jgi:hypothetical protein
LYAGEKPLHLRQDLQHFLLLAEVYRQYLGPESPVPHPRLLLPHRQLSQHFSRYCGAFWAERPVVYLTVELEPALPRRAIFPSSLHDFAAMEIQLFPALHHSENR